MRRGRVVGHHWLRHWKADRCRPRERAADHSGRRGCLADLPPLLHRLDGCHMRRGRVVGHHWLRHWKADRCRPRERAADHSGRRGCLADLPPLLHRLDGCHMRRGRVVGHHWLRHWKADRCRPRERAAGRCSGCRSCLAGLLLRLHLKRCGCCGVHLRGWADCCWVPQRTQGALEKAEEGGKQSAPGNVWQRQWGEGQGGEGRGCEQQ